MSDNSTTTATSTTKARKAFIPLECNPDVMTTLIHKLGISKKLSFHDVYSIDEPELLAFVPRPVHALLLVFPVTKTYQEAKSAEDADKPHYNGSGDEENVIWFKQTIKNACGMFGVLHGVCNGGAREYIVENSELAQLLAKAIPLKPAERAELVESSDALESAHQSAASGGDTEAPDAEEDIDLHYICFVKSSKDKHLYELDGGRKGPLDRGYLGDDDVFAEKALEVVRNFIKREKGENINFSMVALAPTLD